MVVLRVSHADGASVVKLCLDDCVELAKLRGGTCLSSEYQNTKQKLLWKCFKCDHEWSARFSDVKNGSWCPRCAKAIKYTINNCIDFAHSKNGECLSSEYKTNTATMQWKCNICNYEWNTSFSNAMRGDWCQNCNKIEHMAELTTKCIELAKSKNGECDCSELKNSMSKIKWICNVCNYSWFSALSSVLTGRWCRKCAHKLKHTLQDCIDFARNKNGECLSTQYTNSRTLMTWKCNICQGQWNNTFMKINSGQWCPTCSTGKNQKQLIKILNVIFGSQFKQTREMDWLRNPKTGRNLEIDAYNKNLKIAIEYDGIQHFEPRTFGTRTAEEAKQVFSEQKEMDNLKNKLIQEHITSCSADIKYFVRIDYTQKLTEENIKKILSEHGLEHLFAIKE